MSIVIARNDSDQITMCCDTQVSFGEDGKNNVYDCKIFKINDNLLIGAAGSAHIISLFRGFIEIENFPDSEKRSDIILFFERFHNWSRERLEGFNESIANIVSIEYLIASNGKLWEFTNFYLRKAETKELLAIGSGSSQAFACSELTDSLQEIVKAVCKHNIYCSEPIEVFEINKYE